MKKGDREGRKLMRIFRHKLILDTFFFAVYVPYQPPFLFISFQLLQKRSSLAVISTLDIVTDHSTAETCIHTVHTASQSQSINQSISISAGWLHTSWISNQNIVSWSG